MPLCLEKLCPRDARYFLIPQTTSTASFVTNILITYNTPVEFKIVLVVSAALIAVVLKRIICVVILLGTKATPITKSMVSFLISLRAFNHTEVGASIFSVVKFRSRSEVSNFSEQTIETTRPQRLQRPAGNKQQLYCNHATLSRRNI